MTSSSKLKVHGDSGPHPCPSPTVGLHLKHPVPGENLGQMSMHCYGVGRYNACRMAVFPTSNHDQFQLPKSVLGPSQYSATATMRECCWSIWFGGFSRTVPGFCASHPVETIEPTGFNRRSSFQGVGMRIVNVSFRLPYTPCTVHVLPTRATNKEINVLGISLAKLVYCCKRTGGSCHEEFSLT